MSIIRFIGDVHGKYSRYKKLLEESPHRTHQVGDMGVGFRKYPYGDFMANPPFDLMVEKDATFHRGNHDNPSTCRAHARCIQDGKVIDNMMFVGGAVSIDKAYRIKDFTWWEDEELSEDELMRMIEIYAVAKPEIMVTHECSESIAEMIVNSLLVPRNGWKKLDPNFASRTRFCFERMLEDHAPKLWLFGHWHVPFDHVFHGTRFICLPELAQLDVDTEKAEPIGDVIMQREKW